MSVRFVSEDDFVANQLLPELKEGAKELGLDGILDFHKNVRIDDIGWADVTVSKGGKEILVVEAKFKKKSGKLERDIEPRDPEVIKQAVSYAANGGFPYYATCNATRLVLFQLRSGSTPYESEIASYEYTPAWATSLLRYAVGLQSVSLKAPDDSLVDTLREAFTDIWPELFKSLKIRLSSSQEKDKKFARKYKEWLEDQGLVFADESHKKIARETAYIQINKLVFYKVIRTSYPYLKELKIEEDEEIQKTLQSFYGEVSKIDYKAVYQSDVISEIPLTARVEVRLRTLIDTLNDFDFAKFRSDFVGRVYEKLIPVQERRDLGQFYTPPSVVDFIVNLTIENKNAVVLDPGCGSGGFLVKAYHKLRELNGAPENLTGPLGDNINQQLLDKIYGVDINQFPAHLSVINLAVQNSRSKSNRINVMVKDFFDLKPGIEVLSGFETIDSNSEKVEIKLPTYFDCIVANPPYIRQELLGAREKDKIRKLIESEYRAVSVGYSGSARKIVLDKQSDIYIYFFLHSLAFLRKEGRLGFISSNKWLEVGYGKGFQQFLLESSMIQYVVEFDRAVFADAEVDTCVTILVKEPERSARDNNLVKFVRLKRALPLNVMLQRIGTAEQSEEDENFSINVIRQKDLRPGKWNIHLRAPPVYQKLVSSPKIRPFSEIADILFGLKTGYNDYFILEQNDLKEWKIEGKFLAPCVSSPKNLDSLVINKSDLFEYFFMAHGSKAQLKGTNALRYIEFGEKFTVEVERGFDRGRRHLPNLESVKAHKPWYSLPSSEAPDILLPYMIRERFMVWLNKVKALAANVFHYAIMKKGRDASVLAGYLNSSPAKLLCELYGRQYTGMLKMETYEWKEFPVLDPSFLSKEQCKLVSNTFINLDKALRKRVNLESKLRSLRSSSKEHVGLFEKELVQELEVAQKEEKETQQELDRYIYNVLGLTTGEGKQIEQGLVQLQVMRRSRSQE
ncbi:MAG: N-6 DNA methylase [Nitrososphaerota archaeon]|nr:N-6 DNA methylase [Nitrososphaerota archaeon]